MTVRFPGNQNRTTIIGPTGSGKTVFAIWLLSTCKTLDWKKWPVIVFDFKGDEFIEQIEDIGGATEISVHKPPPKKPGLYVVRPHPHETEAVEQFLWRVWANGYTGLYFDEGYMVGKSKALNAILTQGRSKRIPVMILLQRPVLAPRFCFSEAQYYAIFYQHDSRDVDTVKSYVNADVGQFRGPYHALWYDVGANAGRGQATVFSPVPPQAEILEVFRPKKTALRKKVI